MMHSNKPNDSMIKTRVGRNVFATPPRISVIIPAYNAAKFIEETLASVVAQKYREHEIIVINDGSPDTLEFERAINLYLEDIVYIRQPNRGAGVARNTGIEHARGQIIAFLDADDVWCPEYLASQFIFLERHGFDMVYCDAHLFGTNSPYRRTFMETAPSVGEANFESILDLRCNVITSGTMVRKKAVIDAGLFETERVRSHDFHLWLRIARNNCRIGYQQKPLLKHRVHVDSLSGDSVSRLEREIQAFERVQRSIELDGSQHEIVNRRLSGLNADLDVEQGKALLMSGKFREAAAAFGKANKQRRSLKLSVITVLTRLMPHAVVKFYKKHRPAEIAMLPR